MISYHQSWEIKEEIRYPVKKEAGAIPLNQALACCVMIRPSLNVLFVNPYFPILSYQYYSLLKN